MGGVVPSAGVAVSITELLFRAPSSARFVRRRATQCNLIVVDSCVSYGGAAALPVAAEIAGAQSYPTRSVRIIVPFQAGGPATVLAHLIAQPLTEAWGQSFYVENLPTGASNVGTATAAKSPPNGHTLLIVTPSFVINPSMYAKLAYDPIKDLTPVMLAVTVTPPRQIAILVNPENPSWRGRPGDLRSLTINLGVNLSRAEAASSDQIESAFAQIVASGANGVLVENDALFNAPGNRKLIADMAKRHRLPTIAENRLLAESGALLGYGASIPAMFEYAASYVDKILKGVKPADLPVEQPTKFVLIVNLTTAKAIGVELPTAILLLADEVIE